ncbi:hypothetical protein DQ239_04840 [Blastococcus sp. TF02-09]|uniref:HAD family hydrolase n=1 Tax=Blastococcus sp. TF02-09 TaxID=2250576 RepID=UPI000DEBAC71|nr:HAD family hydrolase [Blastococcus sp. TF02-9]RBY80378.1 hypothetical protein DQ239_04840 [Blastococcus sp. TF02-9]
MNTDPSIVARLTADSGRPRCVVSDLDGTLLHSDGRLSQNSAEVLKQVHRLGVDVVLATARPYRAARHLLADMPFVSYLICSNGAVGYDVQAKRFSRVAYLPGPRLRTIVAEIRLRHPEAKLAFDTVAGRIVDPEWPRQFLSVPGQASLWPLAADEVPEYPTMCLMVLGAWTSVSEVPSHLRPFATSSAYGLIEFGAVAASKLDAVNWWSSSRHIPLRDVVAFGDMPNDLDLLTASGLGVAVANAHPSILSSVSLRTLSNDHDGVVEFLRQIFLSTELDGLVDVRT